MTHFNDLDPAMRYESLYRFAFNCGRMDDPWEEADQSNYGMFVEEKDLGNAKASLYRILHKLIFDNYKGIHTAQKLIEIEKRINKVTTQGIAIKIIDDTIDIIKQNL